MTDWVGDASLWKTIYFGLQILRGNPVSTNNFAFTDADRVLIDKLLNQIFIHQHTNTTRLTNPMNDPTPSITVALVLSETGGSIPAGQTVCYRVSFYDESGETEASEEETIAMPEPISDPTSPAASTSTTGGTLVSGQYFYAISAVKGNGETYASDPAVVLVGTATTTNKNTITFPSPPSGATYWNIYRKKNNGSFYYMTQVAVANPTWEDTGAISPDCDQEGLPLANTTNSENKVTITLSGVPSGADGYRIYRSLISGYYPQYSLLVDQIIDVTPDLDQIDIYQQCDYGVPLEADGTYGSPPKVQLTGAAEVQGKLPTPNISPLDANLDFAKYQALQFVLHNSATAPSSPVQGQCYWNTTDKEAYIYSGTAWIKLTEFISDCSFVTTAAETKLSNEKVLGTDIIMRGLAASKPTASIAGRIYIETDGSYIVWRDTGTTWNEIARGEAGIRLAQLSEKAHGSLTGVSTDQHHAQLHNSSHTAAGGDKLYQWESPTFIVSGDLWDDTLATPAIKACNVTLKPAGNLTIVEVHAHVKTPPQGFATPVSPGVRIDVKKDGASIFVNDGAKPIILNGANDGYSTTILTTALSKNSNLTMVIDTIDDMQVAADLEVFVRCIQYVQAV